MTRKKTKPVSPKPKKSNNAEITRRVNDVYKKLIQRQTRTEILQYATETWQITIRQAETYIAKANALLKQQAAYDRDTELVMAVELMKFVIRKTLGVMDYQRTISAQREINNMLGLYAPTKSDTTVRVIDMDAVKDAIRRKIEAGEMTRDQALQVTDNDTDLVNEFFKGAASRVSVGKE